MEQKRQFKKQGTAMTGSEKAVPEHIRQQSSFLCAVIFPEVPGAIERDHITPDDADYLILGVSRKWQVISHE